MKKMQLIKLQSALLITGIFASPFAFAAAPDGTPVFAPVSPTPLSSTTTLEVTLSDSSSIVPTGSVTFSIVPVPSNGANCVAPATLDGTGKATCTLNLPLPADTYTITASYAGDATYIGGPHLSSYTLTVDPAPLALSAPVASPDPIEDGSSITLSATLSGLIDPPFAGPSTITFLDTLSATVLCQVTGPHTNGPVSCSFTAGTAGTNYSFQAIYTPDVTDTNYLIALSAESTYTVIPASGGLGVESVPTNTTLTLLLMGLLVTALGAIGIQRRSV